MRGCDVRREADRDRPPCPGQVSDERYRLEIVSRGMCFDTRSDPAGKRIYRIETWVFRMTDRASVRDWARNQPAWEELVGPMEQGRYELEQTWKEFGRYLWERRVRKLLTRRRADEDPEALAWEFVHIFADLFAAVRVTVAYDSPEEVDEDERGDPG